MSEDDDCCRCKATEDEAKGKRACHLTCGNCIYPENWDKCASCEVVGHCQLAIEHFKTLNVPKGCIFASQLTGEENAYQIANFVDGEERRIAEIGVEKYLKELEKKNKKSKCLRKD